MTENNTTPTHAAPAKKTHRVRNVILIAFALIVVGSIYGASHGGSSTAAAPAGPAGAAAAPTKDTRTVVYKVTGTTTQASLTLQTASGTSQQNDVDVPVMSKSGTEGLTYEVEPYSFVYVSAQNSKDTGSVTCSIEVDGVVIATNTSSGAYAIASCSGTAK
jgi:hypothetical protein